MEFTPSKAIANTSTIRKVMPAITRLLRLRSTLLPAGQPHGATLHYADIDALVGYVPLRVERHRSGHSTVGGGTPSDPRQLPPHGAPLWSRSPYYLAQQVHRIVSGGSRLIRQSGSGKLLPICSKERFVRGRCQSGKVCR